MTADALHLLRDAVERERAQLRAALPADRRGLVVALLAEQDALAAVPATGPLDLVTGGPMPELGVAEALALCLAGEGGSGDAGDPIVADRPAARALLAACREVAAAELVAFHAETGFLRLAAAGPERIEARVASRRAPAVWRERAEVAWLTVREAALPAGETSHQLPYPAGALLGGCAVGMHRETLAVLRALPSPDAASGPGAGRVLDEATAAEQVADRLGLDPATAQTALGGFVLDAENARFHAAPPGGPAAPLVRLDGKRLAWSRHGLAGWPMLFLARELRRRDPAAYHNAAAAREGVFREELLGRFAGPRFVRAPGRIALRQAGGEVGTDIDAALFDRKTGALALFELKSPDPFAESAAALLRQRDNILQANRQVSRTLAWVQRNGGDALLARMLPTAREGSRASVRVAKVLPFVLGRYLVAFDDGAARDPRAAWGTWPDVLRLLDGAADPAAARSPLASLFAGLQRDARPPLALKGVPPREIALGSLRVVVAASGAAGRDRLA